MHHVNHVRKNNYKLIDKEKTWLQAVSLRNRNQIPLCKECYVSIHTGKYGGQKIALLCPFKIFDHRIITIESHITKASISDNKVNYTKTLEEKGWAYIGQKDKDT